MLKTFRFALFWSVAAALVHECQAANAQETRQEKEQQQPKKQSKREPATASLTGCVDQQNGDYVLINGQTTELIASLQAVGFTQEGFAKHLGHKVTVKGTSAAKDGRPVFQVRSIETVSDTCAP